MARPPAEPGREYPHPEEERRALDFAADLQERVAETTEGSTMVRAVQAKHHGCVRAEFTVADSLHDDLKVGLFAAPATYPAWVRFATQSPRPRSDRRRDIRGMAVKLFDVPHRTLAATEPDSGTVDFIMISAPVFVTRDAQDFYALRRATDPPNIPRALRFFLQPRQFRTIGNILRALAKPRNPLSVRYFSATPYAFGTRAVKYSAIPTFEPGGGGRKTSGDDFLAAQMADTLSRQDVSFDFAVQFQTDPASMPIEDAGKRWDEERSPFRKVATLRIPRQTFGTPQQQRMCEDVAFDPWRTPEEHRPLGAVNRARRVIYPILSAQRHAYNDAPRGEPTGDEL